MESAHQFPSRPDCNNTAEVPSSTLRTALSAIPFVSDLWCRRTMVPGRIFTSFAKFQGIVSVNNFSSYLAPRTIASFSGFLVKFLYCTDMIGSSGWPSPAPRLYIDDCFEIRNCHQEPCDLLLSSHRNSQLEVRLRHCVFCMGPL